MVYKNTKNVPRHLICLNCSIWMLAWKEIVVFGIWTCGEGERERERGEGERKRELGYRME